MSVCMSKMIQIRHVPEEVHQKLREKALRANLTLSDFLLREIRSVADTVSWEDALDQIDSRSPTKPQGTTARAVRRERVGRVPKSVR